MFYIWLLQAKIHIFDVLGLKIFVHLFRNDLMMEHCLTVSLTSFLELCVKMSAMRGEARRRVCMTRLAPAPTSHIAV